jgi:hypothetical protein
MPTNAPGVGEVATCDAAMAMPPLTTTATAAPTTIIVRRNVGRVPFAEESWDTSTS